ncbi:flagellar hook-associated protein [Parvularcula bermudensis HTCC2503]|uniref:Flagellar hook-associated protein 1 n=1 Tax=Parvularcula bermudensis (strain ATCC BAA-594 / HTCC2503 / KCTC 12087) TaxID=314260 RepID=E0TGK3_PARBH|nr:flagellar hook-associated protein FlgK [Parvularcula bermudensis]ADM09622.1 flagellar hook-associated protein [Parvularcula bermudensis HTCC2503]
MSFSSALSIANSGLAAASIRAQTTASNIANATVEGYSRRDVVLSERVVGSTGIGVSVVGTERVTSPVLTSTRIRLEAADSFATQTADTAKSLTQIVGEPGAQNGLFGAYNRFEASLRDAAATPESSIFQAEVADSAQNLIRVFANASQDANDLRRDADQEIGRLVNEVNEKLERLEDINGLPEARISPEILDERQKLVDEINEIIPVTAQNRGGQLKLISEGGQFLLDTTAREISFSTTGAIGRTAVLGAPLSGLTVNGVDITPTGSAAHKSSGGRIGALFEARDVTVPGLQDKLDGLAFDLVSRFAGDTVDPTIASTDAGLFTDGNTTAPTASYVGIAEALELNAAVDPDEGGELYRIQAGIGATAPAPSGNGDQLNRLIDAFGAERAAPPALGINGNASAVDLVAEVNAAVTEADAEAQDDALYASTRAQLAREEEQAIIGVDTDRELQQLLLIEQAYGANARVIQTIDEMLDILMRLG